MVGAPWSVPTHSPSLQTLYRWVHKRVFCRLRLRENGGVLVDGRGWTNDCCKDVGEGNGRPNGGYWDWGEVNGEKRKARIRECTREWSPLSWYWPTMFWLASAPPAKGKCVRPKEWGGTTHVVLPTHPSQASTLSFASLLILTTLCRHFRSATRGHWSGSPLPMAVTENASFPSA